MNIIIDSKSSLTAFVQRVSAQTSMNPSRLKTAISKAYGFKHITAFESVLENANKGSKQFLIDCQTEEAEIIEYRSNALEHIKADAPINDYEEDGDFELHAGLYDDAEDTLSFCANELTSDTEALGKALAVLKSAGLSDVASKIKGVARSSILLEYLKENV
tara:strand:- start:2716 stop:3198 length:483 start_codon:yes stop_codon:yes gene_type:complete